MTRYLKQNAVCVINCSWDKSELEKQLPAKMRKDLAEKQALMANGSGAIPQTYSQMVFLHIIHIPTTIGATVLRCLETRVEGF